MAIAALAVTLPLLAGCQKSFDERYAAAEKQIRDKAGAIDKDLAARASEAALAEALASGAPAPPSAPASAGPR